MMWLWHPCHVWAYRRSASHSLQRAIRNQSPIGEVIGSNHQGFREAQVGNAQAWYYPAEKTIVLWECFFDDRFRKRPLPEDVNMQKLWQSFEHWLLQKFPDSPGFSGKIATH